MISGNVGSIFLLGDGFKIMRIKGRDYTEYASKAFHWGDNWRCILIFQEVRIK